MKATLVILVLKVLVFADAFAVDGHILSEDFVNFHNSRTDVTWKVRTLNKTYSILLLSLSM